MKGNGHEQLGQRIMNFNGGWLSGVWQTFIDSTMSKKKASSNNYVIEQQNTNS